MKNVHLHLFRQMGKIDRLVYPIRKNNHSPRKILSFIFPLKSIS